MSSHFIALSDLHLGYDHTLLGTRDAQENLAEMLADLCSGETDRLILNGDTFEGCVPYTAGQVDDCGYSPAMADAGRNFFEAIASKVRIRDLIIVWGNHDYAVWKKLAADCGVSTFTNNCRDDVVLQKGGHVLGGAGAFLDDVIGPARSNLGLIKSAYPNYILGSGWPYLVFHHGHFLDDLVLGQDPEIEYEALRLLTGHGRPDVNINDELTLEALHTKTDAFIASTWELNSKARQLEWSMIRRSEKNPKCSFYPTCVPGALPVPSTEPQDPQLGHRAPWYANLLTADPTTPPPIGPLDTPSYLFIGHDHAGGFADFTGMDGAAWKYVNTGGWTNDRGSNAVHGHVTVWLKDEMAPSIHCVAV